MSSIVQRVLRQRQEIEGCTCSEEQRDQIRKAWRGRLTQREFGALEALESLTPQPRPASELTEARLKAWEWWMLEYRVSHMDYDKFRWLTRSRASMQPDPDGEPPWLYDVTRVYPLLPDLTNGPIPATWEQVDAAVAAQACARDELSRPDLWTGATTEAIPSHTGLMVTPESIPDDAGTASPTQGYGQLNFRTATLEETEQMLETVARVATGDIKVSSGPTLRVGPESDIRAMVARLAELEAENARQREESEPDPNVTAALVCGLGYIQENGVLRERCAELEARMESLDKGLFTTGSQFAPAVMLRLINAGLTEGVEPIQFLDGLLARLVSLDAYLDNRGLPKDTSPDRWEEWGWVVCDTLDVVGVVYARNDCVAYTRAFGAYDDVSTVVSWVRATPEQRAAARKTEAK